MRIRKSLTPILAPTKKQPVRKCTTKSPINSSASPSRTPAAKPAATKRATAARAKQAKKDEEASAEPEFPSGEDTEGSINMQVTPARKVVTFTRSAAKRSKEKNETLASDKRLDDPKLESRVSINTRIEESKEKAVVDDKDVEISMSDRLLSERASESGDSINTTLEDSNEKTVIIDNNVEIIASNADWAPQFGDSMNSRVEESKEKAVMVVNDVITIASDTLLSEQKPDFGDSTNSKYGDFEKEAEVVAKDVPIIPPSTFLSEEVPICGGSLNSINEESKEKESIIIEMEIIESDTIVNEVGECVEKEHTTIVAEVTAVEDPGDVKMEVTPIACIEESSKQEKPAGADVTLSLNAMKAGEMKEEEAVEEDQEEQHTEGVKDDEELNILSSNIAGNNKEEVLREDCQIENEEFFINDEIKQYEGKVDLGEHGEDEIGEENVQEPVEENETSEEENRELSDMARERKIKKEHEIFVGGVDKDATEEDVRKVFEIIGEIVEVRLHKNLSTNKNKGYAFVTFSSKENAKQALAEMKNPIIAGKKCVTAPSEDNTTLFLGNICNTWKKEAIKQKMEEYGVEGVEKITLVADIQHEGLSRGFAFVEFFCHNDAMLAYKRLQKPDVIFGHAERTVKVAIAAPLHEPDPEIMAQVKSVFIDGIPLYWDERQIRERLKCYGDIVWVVLARNLLTAKRKDFGFVDFSTHKEAIACINGLNNTELGDGNSKKKIKARLSNPLPKTQVVKGGICGGFRIGHGSGGAFPKFGRSFTPGGNSFRHPHFTRAPGPNRGGRVQRGRMGFVNRFEYENPYSEFNKRQDIGGRRGSFSGGHFSSVRGAAVSASSRPLLDGSWRDPDQSGGRRGSVSGGHFSSVRGAAVSTSSRPLLDGSWRDPPGREYGFQIRPRQQPYPSEALNVRPFFRPQFDGQYSDNVHGTKRPYSMLDHGPDYMEADRVRQRFDYSNPMGSFQGNPYGDAYGSGSSSQLPNNFYGPDYGGGSTSSFYQGERPFGRKYYH